VSSTEQFQQLIEKEIGNFCAGLTGRRPPELYEPLKYMLSLGGKRIRPLLALLACDLFDGDIAKAINSALGLELFHNFSLIHDDIMDNAPLRRNKETVHQKWNPSVAILSGDSMFVKAYQLIVAGGNLDVLRVFNEMALHVCEGQQLDMNYERMHLVGIHEYIQMIELKTASLIATSLKIGAMIACAREEDVERIFGFGKNIGIAFQLQDDILDTYGIAEKFGKQKGGDIISNKKTFLLLKALDISKHNAYKNEELKQWIYSPVTDAKQKIEAVTAIFDFLNVRQLAQEEMMKYYNRAIAFLNEIPAEENKKKNMVTLVGNFVNREA
jgi:geranylgeranyl diphosphate synthase type II